MAIIATDDNNRLATPETDHRAGAVPHILLFVIGTLLLFLLVRNGTDFVTQNAQEFAPLWVLLIPAPAALFWWVRYDVMAAFMRRFFQASAIFIAFYFATEPFAIPVAAMPADHAAVIFHQHIGRWLGLALALAAWFRPAALYPAAMILWFMRDLNGPITGFYFSNLDIRNVVEVMAFAGAGFTLLAAARQHPKIRSLLGVDDLIMRQAALIIFAIGVGGHFGNYFYSALAKLALDGGVWSWIFDNRLYDGVPGALERETYPFAAWPAAGQFVYEAMRFFNLPMHVLSFAAQFVAIAALYKRRWVMGLTIVYDIFHITVYVTLGLLFWKWIALNAVILATLAKVPDEWWTRSVRVFAIGAALFGAIFFKTATLAWYDAPGFMSVFFEAETKEGSRYRVPAAYFHSASYQVSQGRLYAPPSIDHFNFSIWGSVLPHADLEAGRECKPPVRAEPTEERYGPVEAIAAYVTAQHEAAIKNGGDDGRFNYRAYIHHHMPSPFVAKPFDAVDKRDIRAYYFVAESVCLGLEKGRLKRDLKARTEIPLVEFAE